jgi:hypothetical protein
MSDQLAILNNGQQRNLFLQELISHAAVSLSGHFSDAVVRPPRGSQRIPEKMQIVLLHIVII